MVVTRQVAEAAFDHIIDVVLSRHGSTELKQALVKAGVYDVFDLLTIDKATLDSLVYTDPSDATQVMPLHDSDKTLIKLFRDYTLQRHTDGDPIGDEWLLITQESFDDFCASPANIDRLTSAAIGGPTVQASSSTKLLNSEVFPKGIKCDMPIFPTAKDEKYNDQCHRSFMTQARAQDVDKVYETYVPTPQEKHIVIEVYVTKEDTISICPTCNDKRIPNSDETGNEMVGIGLKDAECIIDHPKEKEHVDEASEQNNNKLKMDFPEQLSLPMVMKLLNLIYPLTQIAVVVTGMLIVSSFITPIIPQQVGTRLTPSELPQPWLIPPWIAFDAANLKSLDMCTIYPMEFNTLLFRKGIPDGESILDDPERPGDHVFMSTVAYSFGDNAYPSTLPYDSYGASDCPIAAPYVGRNIGNDTPLHVAELHLTGTSNDFTWIDVMSDGLSSNGVICSNFCAVMSDGEESGVITDHINKSKHSDAIELSEHDGPGQVLDTHPTVPIFNQVDLIGQSFLMDANENGEIHPELDASELLDDNEITVYQSLIGALQWAVSIGRFDIHTSVMTMSGFRVAPRRNHLERVKRICSYLYKMKNAAIRIRVDEPDYSDVPDFQYDWAQSVYGNVKEYKPTDAPKPLGKYVTLTHYVDANLMHDLTTGRSVTGILHLLNKTPIDWYSKKQATVETATYGSEYVAARTCVEQIVDLRTTLYYLGVPVRDKSYMFGDNQSVVDSSMQVNAKLHKRHNILSFHRVREAIASGMILFTFITGDINPADILSKHWGYSQVWPQLKALLFWYGDTNDISDES